MQRILVFVSGFLFGLGLAIGGMLNPLKVQNFLDVAGTWDPTLMFVMGGGLVVTAVGYRLVFRRDKPFLADAFALPTRTALDAKLLAGAAIFGVGWGISGFCPGPAIASLVFLRWQCVTFVAAMAAGIAISKLAQRRFDMTSSLARPTADG